MSKIKELKDKYGITATLVGGSLVVGSVFGQCVLSPPDVVVEESPLVPMSELLLGLVGGLIVVVTAFVTRLLSRSGDASSTQKVVDKAVTSHEAKVEEVEEILKGKTPEEGLAAIINESFKNG
jgi:hypothetical protein